MFKVITKKQQQAIRLLAFYYKIIKYGNYKKGFVCDIIKNNFIGFDKLKQKDRIISKFLEERKPQLKQIREKINELNLELEKKKNEARAYRFVAKKFYESPEWRSLRYEVLKEQGARCCLCGRTAKDGVVLHVDHIIPLSKDWSRRLDKDNLQVLCEDCNLGKSNKDCIDWR